LEFCIAVAYTDPNELCEIARTAEAAGFGGVIVSDHVIYPGNLRTPYPYTSHGRPRWEADTPWPDPLIAIGAMAAVTERIRFISSIYLLGLRHPVLAAKSVATAAVMSQNRLTLGVGAGWMREEFDLLGQPFARRGPRLEESIAVLRKLFRGGMVEHHGEFYDFDPIQMSPVPDRPVPLYGGGISDRALRRAATVCDGWASEIQTTAELDIIIEKLRTYRRDSPHANEPMGICAALRDVINLEGYRAMAERGVTELITVPWLFYGDATQSCARKCEGIRRFGDEVIGKL
jgi:probable F420-dependent oxidoreductase